MFYRLTVLTTLILAIIIAFAACRETPVSPAHQRVEMLLQSGKYQDAMREIDKGLMKNPADRHLLEDRLTVLLSSEDDSARSALLATQKSLGKAGGDQEHLLDQSRNKSAKVRLQVAYVLGEFRDKKAIKTLRRLTDDADENVRAEAIHALAKINDPSVKYLLLVRLRDGNWKVRAEAVSALEQLGDGSVSSQLFRIADDADAYVRSVVLLAILTLTDQSQVELYLKEIHSGVSAREVAAALALGKLQHPEAAPKLLELLKNKTSEERPMIARQLLKICPDKMGAPLKGMVIREKDQEVKALVESWLANRPENSSTKNH